MPHLRAALGRRDRARRVVRADRRRAEKMPEPLNECADCPWTGPCCFSSEAVSSGK